MVVFPPVIPFTSQVTMVFVDPVTVARNAALCPTTTVAELGERVSVTPLEPPPFCVEPLPLPLHPARKTAVIHIASRTFARRIVHLITPFRFQASTRFRGGEKRHSFRHLCIACTPGQAFEGFLYRWRG